MTEWYFRDDGDQVGPVSAKGLKEMAKHGRVKRTTEVRRCTDNRWHHPKSVRGLVFGPDSEMPVQQVAATGSSSDALLSQALDRIREQEQIIAQQSRLIDAATRQSQSIPFSRPEKSRTIAGLLALFLGGLGIHHFYMGKPVFGILYLCFIFTFPLPSIIALIEAIALLTMSDEMFAANLQARKQKEAEPRRSRWF